MSLSRLSITTRPCQVFGFGLADSHSASNLYLTGWLLYVCLSTCARPPNLSIVFGAHTYANEHSRAKHLPAGFLVARAARPALLGGGKIFAHIWACTGMLRGDCALVARGGCSIQVNSPTAFDTKLHFLTRDKYFKNA